MLFLKQPNTNQILYKQMLKSTGSLSNLFSESAAPFLVSRNTENVFCEALGAENLGRSDCSADAALDNVGVGIKTFLHGNGKTLQKVAEFNKDSELYRTYSPKELVVKIAELRNERIEFTKRTYGLNSIIYHCVTRKPGKILLFEMPMDLIQINSISNIKASHNGNTITFEDGLNQYSFNVTKSTLYKRFFTPESSVLAVIDVKIYDQPYKLLMKLEELIEQLQESSEYSNASVDLIINDPPENPSTISAPIFLDDIQKIKEDFTTEDYVILPLFSDRGAQRHVPEKSGLNQWNAAGRPRNPNEVYISIPSWIHKDFKGFFPPRDLDFQLRLPDKSRMSAKVCQENSKALMSNPNSRLGEWLLRQVMDLEEKELLTYDRLMTLGIDSVIVFKHSEREFSIDFRELGTYDLFENENKTK
ncbi:NgoFVII family restriction endonuclease [Metabacillus sp. 84]|uniref:NgoFVII family restriction endonuclease n=1 Tax=Metabacillus sp. 84 TaxID=3404705 RepID=UPI003CEB3321